MTTIRIDKTQAHLVSDLFDQYRVFYKQPSNLETAKRFIQERLDHNESVIFLTLDADKPIGFTQLYPSYSSVRAIKSWILNDLYVDEAYRRNGIGENLIHTALDFARNDGAKFVTLSTAVDNYHAQRLYEQIGFKKLEPETDFFTYRISISD